MDVGGGVVTPPALFLVLVAASLVVGVVLHLLLEAQSFDGRGYRVWRVWRARWVRRACRVWGWRLVVRRTVVVGEGT